MIDAHYVDGTNLLGNGVQLVEQRQDGLLVGYGDIESGQTVATNQLRQSVEIVGLDEVVAVAQETFEAEFLFEIFLRVGVPQPVSEKAEAAWGIIAPIGSGVGTWTGLGCAYAIREWLTIDV